MVILRRLYNLAKSGKPQILLGSFHLQYRNDACLNMKQSWVNTQFSSLHLEAQYQTCIIFEGIKDNKDKKNRSVELLKWYST